VSACANEIPSANEFACGHGGPCPSAHTAVSDGGPPAEGSDAAGVVDSTTTHDGSASVDAQGAIDAGAVATDRGPRDTGGLDTPPVVTFIRPATRATVTGEVDILVSATDDSDITSLVIRHELDVLPVTPAPGGLYSATWSSCGHTGAQVLIAIATDDAGQTSEVTVLVDPDNPRPSPPTVDAYPEVTSASTVQLTGAKPGGAALTLNGAEIVVGGSTTWSHQVALGAGARSVWHLDTADVCWPSSGAPVRVEILHDDTAPTLSVTSPTAGQAVSGAVAIAATATDDHEVVAIWVDIDGGRHALAASGTLAATWQSTTVADGMHQLEIGARDRAGNTAAFILDVVVTNDRPPLLVSVEPALGPGMEGWGTSIYATVSVTAQGDRVVVWQDRRDLLGAGNDYDIFLASYDAMRNSNGHTLVSDGLAGRSREPSSAASSAGGSHIVWSDDGDNDGDGQVDYDIVYRHWDGATLGPLSLVSTDLERGSSRYPRVADGGGDAHVVWEDNGDVDGDGNGDTDVYYTRASGSAFSPIEVVSPSSDDSARPAIAVSPGDGCPHVVWSDEAPLAAADTDSVRDVYYRGSSGAGCSWGPVLLVSTGMLDWTLSSAIAFDPTTGGFWIAYEQSSQSGFERQVYARTLVGTSLGPQHLISDANIGLADEPSIVVAASGAVHMVWIDDSDAGSGVAWDVFMRTGTSGGVFGPIVPLSVPTGSAHGYRVDRPSLAIAGTSLVVVWEDNGDYDGDGVADYDIVLVER